MLVSLVSSLYKYCLLPKGLRASLTQTLKNEEPSRAPPENALAFYKFSFFLISRISISMKYAKNAFFSISTGYGIWGAQNDLTGLASIFTIEVDLPRPLSAEI